MDKRDMTFKIVHSLARFIILIVYTTCTFFGGKKFSNVQIREPAQVDLNFPMVYYTYYIHHM